MAWGVSRKSSTCRVFSFEVWKIVLYSRNFWYHFQVPGGNSQTKRGNVPLKNPTSSWKTPQKGQLLIVNLFQVLLLSEVCDCRGCALHVSDGVFGLCCSPHYGDVIFSAVRNRNRQSDQIFTPSNSKRKGKTYIFSAVL